MNKANFINTQTASGHTGRYPLSTETLDLLQGQAILAAGLAHLGANVNTHADNPQSNYILQQPDGTNAGLCVIAGELLPMAATPIYTSAMRHVSIVTQRQDITADDETYIEARTIRTARFSAQATEESVPIETFVNYNAIDPRSLFAFPTNASLHRRINDLQLRVKADVMQTISEVLAERLPFRVTSGLSQMALDAATTPRVLSCYQSVSIAGSNAYTIVVSMMDTVARQTAILPDGSRYERCYDPEAATWSNWQSDTPMSVHIEAKVVRGTVYLRHGNLPAGASIVLLRKKRRSQWRRTGAVRQRRAPKTQYVHFKGITLSTGTPGQWYVPKCVAADACFPAYETLIGKELPTLCRTLLYEDKKVAGVYHLQGLRRNIVFKDNDEQTVRRKRHGGYVRIAVALAYTRRVGSQGHLAARRDSGGPLTLLRFRVQNQQYKKQVAGQQVTAYRLRTCFSVE